MLGIFERAAQWYKKLPWYWKLVGWLVFVLLIGAVIAAMVSPSLNKQMLSWFKEADKLHEDQVDEELSDLTKQDDAILKGIIEKKKELATKINQAAVIDQEAMDRRKKITGATTMEELDKIQKEYGL